MIGDRLKQLRKEKSLSQQELAKRLDTSSGYISELEQGKKQPGTEFLFSLKREFNVDLNWLIASTAVHEPGTSFAPPSLDALSRKILELIKDMDGTQKKEILRLVEKEKLLQEYLAEKKQRKVPKGGNI